MRELFGSERVGLVVAVLASSVLFGHRTYSEQGSSASGDHAGRDRVQCAPLSYIKTLGRRCWRTASQHDRFIAFFFVDRFTGSGDEGRVTGASSDRTTSADDGRVVDAVCWWVHVDRARETVALPARRAQPSVVAREDAPTGTTPSRQRVCQGPRGRAKVPACVGPVPGEIALATLDRDAGALSGAVVLPSDGIDV